MIKTRLTLHGFVHSRNYPRTRNSYEYGRNFLQGVWRSVVSVRPGAACATTNSVSGMGLSGA